MLDAFGEDANAFVFLGGCALGLYARSTGAPLRATKDVDCISTLEPWMLQSKKLAAMCENGRLTPDREIQCRYRIAGTDIDVDVLSPHGFNVGGGADAWLLKAVERSDRYDAGDGRIVKALTPPYFLATKVRAFEDRGGDAQSSKDFEDIITLLVEVPDVVARVTAEGIRAEIAELFVRALAKYGIDRDDLSDLVDVHLHRQDTEHRERVLQSLLSLSSGE